VLDARNSLSTRFSHIPSLCPGLGVADEAPRPYKGHSYFIAILQKGGTAVPHEADNAAG